MKFILNKRNFYILSLFLSFVLFSCISGSKSDINTENPEEAYNMAMKNYNKKDYLQAIEDFSLIKIKFTGTKVIDKAQYYLAMCHYNRKEYILGAYEFDYLLKNYSTSEFYLISRYMLSMCYYQLSPEYYLDQTYTLIAINEFITFIDLYPKDKNVKDAETKVIELKNKLAYKDYKNALLYMTMDDYRSAIVYFDNVLEDYFDSDWADDALYGKIQALIKKRHYVDAKKEIERFEKKFSSSTLLAKVQSMKKDIPDK